jgi:YVTN family beta-propeller protein
MKTLLSILVSLTISFSSFAQTIEKPVRSVPDPGVVTTRQSITPAGVQTIFDGRVYGLTFGETSSEIYALTARGRAPQTQVIRLDWLANKVLSRTPLAESPGLQGIVYDAAANRALVSATISAAQLKKPKSAARLLALSNGASTILSDELGNEIAGALTIAREKDPEGRRIALVPLVYNNQAAVVDLETGKLLGKIAVGIAPFGAVLNRTGTIAYITNWGGRRPTSRDKTLPTGLDPNADRVVVDARGIASTGSVTRVDLKTMSVTHTIPTELHPTGIVWDENRGRVYVANNNSDSISVIDAARNTTLQSIMLSDKSARGYAPTALALSADGDRLYVACGGLNAVAVIETATRRIAGLIPTGWYPNALSLSADGNYLAVGTLLGAGSGWREEQKKRFVHSYRGSVSVLPVPGETQLASYTTAVYENNHLNAGVQATRKPTANRAPTAIPARAGDPSLIEHVVYIIKENRTYDQLFGDIAKGNGDPDLVMFGEDVTPNHHRLAEQYTLLDNFYATGGNSGDGHQWVTQANETAYCLWPGYTGRSYPFDGTDPIAYSDGGFIWDAALKMKKTVRVFGEYAGRLPESDRAQRAKLLDRWKKGEEFQNEWKISAPLEPLNKILAADYPSYTQSIPDVVRAKIFQAHLKQWETAGSMPNLVLLQLPSDHTRGTSPGVSTPKAMVADNDLALGQIVESLSKSKFWKKMAIFVVEDDAQNGVDHVDGHRTIALAISPYTRRGAVDSTFYAHQSILKTIELILGLPTLSLFDLIANDMRASFTDAPDFTVYEAVEPRQSLFELNPSLTTLRGQARADALASMKMRFDVPDAAPTDLLNRIVWRNVRGRKTPYPGVKQSVFAPLSIETEDEEREGER